MGTGLEVALIGTAIASTGASIYSSEKARKQQRRANQARERIRQAQARRQRVAGVREQLIAQSQIIQSAATQGTTGSSQAQGAYSSVGSLTAGNTQFVNQMDELNQQVFQAMEKANLYGAQAGRYAQLGNLALQGYSMGLGAPTKTSAPASASGSGYGTPGGMSTTTGSAISTAGPGGSPLPPFPG